MIPQKAFLLAAGRGERLRPLTDTIPKCMVPVGGRPMLSIWLELLEYHKITDVLINLHHLPQVVLEFMKQYKGPVRIRTFHEEKLLGSAGTIRENRDFVEGEESFWVFYADNLTNADLTDMRRFHQQQEALLTLGLFETGRPKECGIAELDSDGYVIAFTEKPNHPKSNLASGGIFLCRLGIFDYLPRKDVADFGFDVLPHLVGNMVGYKIQGLLMDVGSPEKYEHARKAWEALS
jgi:mannose-1-phosphate guanylyltransferase